MKKILLLIFSASSFIPALSQLRGNSGEARLGAGNVSWDDQFVILDKNGGSFHSYYEGVEGNPYFIEAFKWASIKLSTGEKFKNVSARLDLYKQMIQIKLNGDTAKYILPGSVSEITFYDTVKLATTIYKFCTGYPEIDKLKSNNFCQVLSEGKVTLLKSSVKKINRLKNEMTGEVSSQFDVYDDYYLFFNNEIKRIKKDKEYILDLLSDKRKELDQYISSKRISFKSMDSIKDLVEYYNSISEKTF